MRPEAYRVWARTIDWVARWDAKPSPGKFQILFNDEPLDETFGTKGADWNWHDGGTVELSKGDCELRLKDLTGFDGRCDCIYLTTDLDATPPPADKVLSDWRRKQLGLPEKPQTRGPYDLVVIGGGYAGMGSAISAARMGCRVALVQDRPVLGGNGSSEVRVWAKGNIRRGKFPRIGEIIEEFADQRDEVTRHIRGVWRRVEGANRSRRTKHRLDAESSCPCGRHGRQQDHGGSRARYANGCGGEDPRRLLLRLHRSRLDWRLGPKPTWRCRPTAGWE